MLVTLHPQITNQAFSQDDTDHQLSAILHISPDKNAGRGRHSARGTGETGAAAPDMGESYGAATWLAHSGEQ